MQKTHINETVQINMKVVEAVLHLPPCPSKVFVFGFEFDLNPVMTL